MAKQFLFLLATISCCHFSWAQSSGDHVINPEEVERIERTLSADDMMGRKPFTPGIEKAANFIADEFKKAGLKPLEGNYFQEFTVIKPLLLDLKGNFDGVSLPKENIIVLTQMPDLTIDEKSGYEKVRISATDTFRSVIYKYINSKSNLLVLVDTVHANYFKRLVGFKQAGFPEKRSLVFVLTNQDPAYFSISARHEITEQKLKNVVGLLPGRSRAKEYVIFAGHYDHLGVGQPNADKDSIFNGANDDAAGTTAVIMLAKYFANKANNERTLIFSAFTAEEMGGFGSKYFSRQFDPGQVMAMFNIEMIGTESKWGTNSAYITGYEKSDMGKILEKNLQGSPFKFYPDPYTEQQLFYRSDNATLARLGVPAHTISTSKMDSEKFYHSQDDEIGTLDLNNMAEIIKAIALSSGSIVAGKDTPSRVDTSQLK